MGYLPKILWGLSLNAQGSDGNGPAYSTDHQHRRHRHRKRRFHRPPEALGVDYENYFVPGAAAPSSRTTPTASLELPEPEATAVEPETLSDREVTTLLSRRGMRWCIWILVIGFVCFQYQRIIAIYHMAVRAWPGLF